MALKRTVDARLYIHGWYIQVAGYVDCVTKCAGRETAMERSTVRILVVVASRLVGTQSAEERKGFMRIVLSHE